MRNIAILFLAAIIITCSMSIGMAAWGKEGSDQVQQGERIVPKKVEVDTNSDGKVDRVEEFDSKGQIKGVKTDSNFDGKIDEWLYYENGKLIKAAKDSNGDGKEDTWLTY